MVLGGPLAATRQAFGLDPPEGLRPKSGGILKVSEKPQRLNDRPQTSSGQRLMPGGVAACVLHPTLGLTQPDGIAAQSEEKITPPIDQDQRHPLGTGERTVAPRQDMDVGSVAASQAQHPLHDFTPAIQRDGAHAPRVTATSRQSAIVAFATSPSNLDGP